MFTLGERLLQSRKKKGWSQTEVARLLGMSTSSISGYEKNQRNPGNKKLASLAELYEVPIGWLLGIEKEPLYTVKDEGLHAFIKDPELERWYRKLPESSEEDLRKLRKMWELFQEDEK